MTREEAIRAMQFYKEKLYNGIFNQYIDAFDMAISALRQLDQSPDSGEMMPLTLDELRQMDGEPVWVVCLKPERYYEPPIGWRIIEKSIVDTFGVWNDSSCLAERDYGKTWLAYRQKPEEGTV